MPLVILAVGLVGLTIWGGQLVAPFPFEEQEVRRRLGSEVPLPNAAEYDAGLSRVSVFTHQAVQLVESTDNASEYLTVGAVFRVPLPEEKAREWFATELKAKTWIHLTEKDPPDHSVYTYSRGEERLTVGVQPDGASSLVTLLRSRLGTPESKE